MSYSNGGPITTPGDDAQLREIVSANADGIIVVDADGVVRFINPAAAAILGRRHDELLGQAFGLPVLRGDRAEIDLLHQDGASHVAEMRVVDTEWEGGPALLVSLRDITEHRSAQQALRDADQISRRARPAPRRVSAAPLRQRSAPAFAQAVAAYRALLDEALRCRAMQLPLPPAGPRQLGEALGAHEAAPRDVIKVHLAAIRAASADAPAARQQAYLEEGRLIALELMGHLAACYRVRALRHDDDTTRPQQSER